MFFVCFIFFLSSVGSVCLAGLLSASKTKTHARTLFKTRASMRRCWHRDSLRSDIWCSFFFCFFPYFSVFVLLFVIFWGNFRSSGQRFFIFFNNKYGRARKKKAQFFFWAQLFLLNRSSGGLDYVMSDDLTSFFFFLIIFWECSHSTTFLGVGKPFFPAIVSFFSVSRSYRLGGCGFLVSSKEASQLFFT